MDGYVLGTRITVICLVHGKYRHMPACICPPAATVMFGEAHTLTGLRSHRKASSPAAVGWPTDCCGRRGWCVGEVMDWWEVRGGR